MVRVMINEPFTELFKLYNNLYDLKWYNYFKKKDVNEEIDGIKKEVSKMDIFYIFKEYVSFYSIASNTPFSPNMNTLFTITNRHLLICMEKVKVYYQFQTNRFIFQTKSGIPMFEIYPNQKFNSKFNQIFNEFKEKSLEIIFDSVERYAINFWRYKNGRK